MELLNRYLHAVGARLPDAYRDDIVAELRGELLSRIEEREEKLRRHLTEPEVVTFLKGYGHPLVVAASYVHGQHLISPALLPFYRFAAQVVIGVDLLAHVIYIVEALIFRESPAHVLGTALNSLWIVTMYLLGTVTFSALILDRIGAGRWLAKAWSPRYLPRAARQRPTRAVLVLDAIAVVTLAGWVSGMLPVWAWIAHPVGSHVHPIGLWRAVGAMLLVLAAAVFVTHTIERSRPRWAVACLLAKLLGCAGALLLTVVLVSSRPWLHVTGLDPRVGEAFAGALDTTMKMGVGVLTAGAAVAFCINAVRLMRCVRRRRSVVAAVA